MEGIKEINEINEIIIKIKNGEQVQEITQKTGGEDEKYGNNYFEFQRINLKEYLEFILLAKNKSGNIINIGSRVYSLKGVVTLKKYLVLLEILEDFKEGEQSNKMGEIIIAEIKMNFLLFPSYYKYYDLQTKIEEPELNKINIRVDKDEAFINKNQYLFGEFGGKMQNSKFEKRSNKESLTKKKI